jgi:N-acyl-D-amino-acid deacylase
MIRALCAALAALVVSAGAPAPGADGLWIRGGQVVDGGGGPAFAADVLVRGDTIVAIGKIDPAKARGARVIDAAGKVVTPGFIDSHAHGDALDDGASFQNFTAQGVTTIVMGQDGETAGAYGPRALPFEAWQAAVERRGLELNIAGLIGHGTLKEQVESDQTTTPEQQKRMEALLDAGMKAGAFGMSTGLEYVPGLQSKPEELEGLAKVVGRADGVIMSHMRTENSGEIGGAIDELLDQGRFARVHVSHIKVVLAKSPFEAQVVLGQLSEARARGIKVTADVYPYLAGFNTLILVYPPWANTQAEWDEAVKHRRPELEAYLRDRVNLRNGPDAILLATPPYAGKTLGQVARERGKPFPDVIIDEFGFDGPKAAHFVMNAQAQDVFILDGNTSFASDGAPLMDHPRSYGTMARIFEAYVATGLLPIEAAVHKASAVPAETLGLKDRGMLKVGMKADLVVFDPAAVRALATWEKPRVLAEGFDTVVINGKIAREHGKPVERWPGRLLRHGR